MQIAGRLITQPSARPTRKVGLGVGIVGAALSAAAVAALNYLVPGLGDELGPHIATAVGALIGWLSAFIGGYMTRDRA